MLLHLHVKNLALIEEEEVTFTDGLNILTGETGAGKSIIIGSVNLALGGKADKSIIRSGAPYALIEMIFTLDNDRQREILSEMDLPVEEDGTVLIKRKILPGRSIVSVCGETVTLHQLREISQCLMDIYGQRENQRLLRREAQLDLIDEYAGTRVQKCRQQVREAYHRWHGLQSEWEKGDLDQAARRREADLLAYEIGEIEEAAIREGEDTELEDRYRKLSGFQKISESASAAAAYTGIEGTGASDMIGRAARELASAGGYDSALDELAVQLSEVEDLLSDFNRSLKSYLMDLTFDPQEFSQIGQRLDVINHMKEKYGRTCAQIEEACAKRRERLEYLQDYENRRSLLQTEMQAAYAKLRELCAELSEARREASLSFAQEMRRELPELNFLQSDFSVELVSGEENLGADGWDRAAFYISMNPGEEPRHLEQIASGGELSRIMLAVKTVFAGKDDIHTFIFDEIDTGISGRTAWKVSQKLGKLAAHHQILCITHLPQIAAMQDSHFLIEKGSAGERTVTHIYPLSQEESDRELARLLGSETITETALQNAREMKKLAAASRERDGEQA